LTSRIRYDKYFKSGHIFRLRNLETPQREVMSAELVRCTPEIIELRLPYEIRAGEEPPLAPGLPIELMTETHGLGMRLVGDVEVNLQENLLRIRPYGDLEAFQRRAYPRVDAMVGYTVRRGRSSFSALRSYWKKAVEAVETGKGNALLTNSVCARINLSAGGVGLPLKAPVALAELCLVTVAIGEGANPICALTEVVRVEDPQEDGQQLVGLRFNEILAEDRRRIEHFVRNERRRQDLV